MNAECNLGNVLTMPWEYTYQEDSNDTYTYTIALN